MPLKPAAVIGSQPAPVVVEYGPSRVFGPSQGPLVRVHLPVHTSIELLTPSAADQMAT